ncbi:hypothetical protein EYF80_064918 [Liparis tanakae]|uniref:Uncharacterized protein n=1 Tax=Liparis tanakae TaxID=230148 RepID=A0A4Z2E861_9TELE|nr:hypothetical protein EYF80_064918 [Liparis tanakae]
MCKLSSCCSEEEERDWDVMDVHAELSQCRAGGSRMNSNHRLMASWPAVVKTSQSRTVREREPGWEEEEEEEEEEEQPWCFQSRMRKISSSKGWHSDKKRLRAELQTTGWGGQRFHRHTRGEKKEESSGNTRHSV